MLLDGRNRVGTVGIPGREGEQRNVVIKEFNPVGVNRLKSLFQLSKARRAWDGGTALLERGINTPLPVAYLEKKKGLFGEKAFYLSELIEDCDEVRSLFRRALPDDLRKIVQVLGRYLSRCHRLGIYHRDLSDGNVLVKKNASGQHTFFLVDTNRIRIKKKIGVLRGVKSLVRLGIPAHLQRFFLSEYLGSGQVSRGMWMWYRGCKNTYTGYIECKKRLRLRQLARKLKIQ
jgi:hypothetical protein